MLIANHLLTYCTNIHPGETWQDTFNSLKVHIPNVKKAVCPDQAFGIGLRLSNQASIELEQGNNLAEFKEWMLSENCFVFTMNGFPYGDFHETVVKDQVHSPDWSTAERLDYTLRLFRILAEIIPSGMEGGISTSPISYRFWQKTAEERNSVLERAAVQLAELAASLHHLEGQTGKFLHLDIEPEPDGILENSDETIAFFQHWLLPVGTKYLTEQHQITSSQAAQIILRHIQVCYDVCHFAIVYERPTDTFAKFETAGIKIGKIQISAALKVEVPATHLERENLKEKLSQLSESTYLHQVVGKTASADLESYPDLPEAVRLLPNSMAEEFRIHFHVPLFLKHYGYFSSTQDAIVEVLYAIAQKPVCKHLEVETYTWGVLEPALRIELSQSIIRELDWVIQHMKA
jgi:hypothetical protein